MNQILAETGFSPEWVRLQREIRAEKARVRGELREVRGRLGPPPLRPAYTQLWTRRCDQLRAREVADINRMIERFNLIVPSMNNQIFPYNFEADVNSIYNMHFKNNSS